MVPDLARNWGAVAARGVAAVVFGLILLFWPAITLLVFVYAFGIFVLVEGVAALYSGLARERSWGLIALGIIAIIAGIATFVWPAVTGLILALLVGFWAIAVGVVEIYEGIRLRRVIANEWLLIVTGIAALFFGLILVVSPGAGVLALTGFIGFFALVYGALQIVLSFRLRGMMESQSR
jgi:uncharacterized membrane protein HdeD (DUF308 family)